MTSPPTRIALLAALEEHFRGLPEHSDISEQKLNQCIHDALLRQPSECVELEHMLGQSQLIHWRLAVSSDCGLWDGSKSLAQFLSDLNPDLVVQAWYVEELSQCMSPTIIAHAVWASAIQDNAV